MDTGDNVKLTDACLSEMGAERRAVYKDKTGNVTENFGDGWFKVFWGTHITIEDENNLEKA